MCIRDSPLLGSYQPYNAAVAITTLKVLDQRGWHISDAAIREGLRKDVYKRQGCR